MQENNIKSNTSNEAFSSQRKQDALTYLSKMIGLALHHGASDIHIRADKKMSMRINGQIVVVEKENAVSESMLKNLMFPLVGRNRLEQYRAHSQVDFSLTDVNGNRARVNFFKQSGKMAAALRVIPCEIPSAQTLSLPQQVVDLGKARGGLLLFAGATGSGKSSSLACILNDMNQKRHSHILTIEDPIEYVFTESKSIITQREIGNDVADFPVAMRAALREDPDIIFLGEMRDPESIEIALNASETGHLVLSTIHAPSTADAITKIASNFEGHSQATIRTKIAQNLTAVVSQKLLPREDKVGRVLACEVLCVNTVVREYIQSPDKIKSIRDVIKQDKNVSGMLYLDDHLEQLVQDGVISHDTALRHASSVTDLSLKLRGF